MALIIKDRVKETCAAPSGSAAFASLSSATGFQTFDTVLGAADTCPYAAEDASGNWETGLGTWDDTAKTLTRTTIYESSTGSAVTFSGTVTVRLSATASYLRSVQSLDEAMIPGGRLTLATGDAIPTTDQTAKTNIYYTPFTHDKIALWNGYAWVPTTFTEYTFPVGTELDAGLPYDLFAYLNSGAIAFEKLAWTSATARATPITKYDGRDCKNTAPDRLYIGSFCASSTTETEDSALNRYLYNHYNKADRQIYWTSGNDSHTYAPGADATQQWNADTSARVAIMVGDTAAVVVNPAIFTSSVASTGAYANCQGSIGINSTTSRDLGICQTQPHVLGTTHAMPTLTIGASTLGARLNNLNMLERTTSSTLTLTANYGSITGWVTL